MLQKILATLILLTCVIGAANEPPLRSIDDPLAELSPEVTRIIQDYIEEHRQQLLEQSARSTLDKQQIPPAEIVTPVLATAAAGGAGWAVGEAVYEAVFGSEKHQLTYDAGYFDLPQLLSKEKEHERIEEATPTAFAAGVVGGLVYRAVVEVLGKNELNSRGENTTSFDIY